MEIAIFLLFIMVIFVAYLLYKHHKDATNPKKYCQEGEFHEFGKWKEYAFFQRKTCKKCGYSIDQNI